MKLKKIASLMLAGVMAVSMLAGCSNGTKPDDDKKDPVVNTGLTGSVIAALDEDTTKNVTFSADSNLQAVLEKAVKNVGYNGLNDLKSIATTMIAIDSDLGKYAPLPGVTMSSNKSSTEATDKETQTAVGLVYVAGEGQNESTIAKALASKIDGEKIYEYGSGSWSDLPTDSRNYTDKDGEYWYDFAYTAGVASVEVSDAVNGQTAYVVAYTVTRTPAKSYK
ncbi:MAG TPA: hypothetical protein H9725_09895 [Candidatus Faecalibacterium gallistercoris]|uniref:Lipoprotein n=1 Tax=Candidatus Faecalibacterium gallistercoris TaxID=2838579 RepID=A0A9D2JNF2_9FIRM|nr:hypothetical protein [Candidatus Faecalibacterium gallistercoris]